MLDIRYRVDRMKALHSLMGSGPTEAQAQQLDEFYQARDEDGMLTLLEAASLTSLAKQTCEILRQAKLVGERLTELGRTIPLPHEKIQELYPQMRDIRLAYERLTTEADRFLTRV
jgi:urease accessory protein UreF